MYKDESDQNARMSSLYLEEIINIKGALEPLIGDFLAYLADKYEEDSIQKATKR